MSHLEFFLLGLQAGQWMVMYGIYVAITHSVPRAKIIVDL